MNTTGTFDMCPLPQPAAAVRVPSRWPHECGLSVALVTVLAITSPSAEAQVCNGAAPFSSGYARIGVGGGRIGAGFGGADGEPSVGARLSLGAAQGLFASVGSSIVLYQRSNAFIREGLAKAATDDASAGIVTLLVGYGVPVASKRFEFCPIAGLTHQSGPLLYADCTSLSGGGMTCSGGADGSARALWVGGTIGGLARLSPAFAVVPFAGAVRVNSRIAAGGRSATDNSFEISVGLGLVYNRLTLRPSLSFPIGLEGGSRSAGIEFALNLGRKN